MRDEHVNAVIEGGLGRQDFTLMVFAKYLTDEVFDRWKVHPRAMVVTEDRCALQGEVGVGHPDLWSFERLSREV